MDQPVDADRIQQIRNSFEDRDTADLLEIWQKNDRQEWTPEAFEAIRQILLERNGTVPEQAVNAGENPPQEEASDPVGTYYDPEKLTRVATFAKSLAWAVIVLFGLLVVFLVIVLMQTFSSTNVLMSVLQILIVLLLPLVYCGISWVMLQAVGEGIYVLMDIEDNTRRMARRKPTPTM